MQHRTEETSFIYSILSIISYLRQDLSCRIWHPLRESNPQLTLRMGSMYITSEASNKVLENEVREVLISINKKLR